MFHYLVGDATLLYLRFNSLFQYDSHKVAMFESSATTRRNVTACECTRYVPLINTTFLYMVVVHLCENKENLLKMVANGNIFVCHKS